MRLVLAALLLAMIPVVAASHELPYQGYTAIPPEYWYDAPRCIGCTSHSPLSLYLAQYPQVVSFGEAQAYDFYYAPQVQYQQPPRIVRPVIRTPAARQQYPSLIGHRGGEYFYDGYPFAQHNTIYG